VVTYVAVVSAPNPEMLLLPGMTATLRIVVNESKAGLKVPNQALRFRPRGAEGAANLVHGPDAVDTAGPRGIVWTVDRHGNAQPIAVQLGRSDENSSLVSGALREGQKVIVGVATPRSRVGFLGIRMGF
jgi:HlyD family secretion protein